MKKFGLAVLMLSVAVGCGPKASAPPAIPTASNATREQIRARLEHNVPVIAVIPKGLVHEFWLTVKKGAEAAGNDVGAQVLWKGPAKETDVSDQISIVEDMVNRSDVKAIVLAACDKEALVGVVKKAKAAGKPVVSIDSGVNSNIPVSFVATDNVVASKAAADTLAKLIGDKGEVGLIPFVPGAATSQAREQGFKEGLKAYPNVKLVATQYSQSDVKKAMDVATDMMTAHPNLAGIFAANESSAMGAAQAIKATPGKAGKVKLVGFDDAPEEIDALKDGTIQALIVQNPFKIGYDGVKIAVDILHGKSVPKRVDTGFMVVTKQNLNTPSVQRLLHPNAPAPLAMPIQPPATPKAPVAARPGHPAK